MSEASPPAAVLLLPPHESVLAPANVVVAAAVVDGDCPGELSSTTIDGASAHAL